MTSFTWPSTLSTLLAGRDLTEAEAASAMTEIMEGNATPVQIAGFMVALRAKGETTDEIVGLVKTMRDFGAKVKVVGEVLDTCGTGGDRTGTFNVSTAAAFVCAGAGVKVAKHGNRAASSRCGSADVLEALGVRIDLPPDAVAACIETAGIGFCFAPNFHPATRFAGPSRKELGVPTIFNFLGPLTNPAGATRQALGVSDPRMVEKMVTALAKLGSRRVLAFHGDQGLDELSISGPSQVFELNEGTTSRWTIDPGELGIEPAPLDAVAGGEAAENADAIRSVFDGKPGPRRDIVVLNSAAGLMAAGRAEDMPSGLTRAADSIDSGAALRSLEALIEASNS
ncbi:MAG: anthranilate phosphoribosyltransferase [Actinomycetota bacterium]|nr:anthranilate phosphoribosyltransferase [Actinomycetota bacterium]